MAFLGQGAPAGDKGSSLHITWVWRVWQCHRLAPSLLPSWPLLCGRTCLGARAPASPAWPQTVEDVVNVGCPVFTLFGLPGLAWTYSCLGLCWPAQPLPAHPSVMQYVAGLKRCCRLVAVPPGSFPELCCCDGPLQHEDIASSASGRKSAPCSCTSGGANGIGCTPAHNQFEQCPGVSPASKCSKVTLLAASALTSSGLICVTCFSCCTIYKWAYYLSMS